MKAIREKLSQHFHTSFFFMVNVDSRYAQTRDYTAYNTSSVRLICKHANTSLAGDMTGRVSPVRLFHQEMSSFSPTGAPENDRLSANSLARKTEQPTMSTSNSYRSAFCIFVQEECLMFCPTHLFQLGRWKISHISLNMMQYYSNSTTQLQLPKWTLSWIKTSLKHFNS